MSWWPRICPVCRQELPRTGNRRVRLPWRPGWALVHAGDCYDQVAAQGMLDLDRKPEPLSPLLQVRARTRVQALLQRHEPIKHTAEQLTAIACLRVVRLQEQLVRDESAKQLEHLDQHALDLVNRLLSHDRRVSGSPRTVVA